jgi:hypothetical protein
MHGEVLLNKKLKQNKSLRRLLNLTLGVKNQKLQKLQPGMHLKLPQNLHQAMVEVGVVKKLHQRKSQQPKLQLGVMVETQVGVTQHQLPQILTGVKEAQMKIQVQEKEEAGVVVAELAHVLNVEKKDTCRESAHLQEMVELAEVPEVLKPATNVMKKVTFHVIVQKQEKAEVEVEEIVVLKHALSATRKVTYQENVQKLEKTVLGEVEAVAVEIVPVSNVVKKVTFLENAQKQAKEEVKMMMR